MSDRTTIEVDGKRWAVNLLWVDSPEEGKAKAAAKAALKADGEGDLFALHSDGDQYGLGVKADGHAKGMPSIAATLAGARNDNWVGMFDADGGYYLLSVRDDRIGTGTDTFIEDRDEAVESFVDIASSQQWDAILTDDPEVYQDAEREDLESLLVGQKPVRLTTPGLPLMPVALAALLLAGGVGGYMFWDHQNKVHIAEMERLEAISRQAALTPPPFTVPDLPYVGEPRARATLEACSEAFLRVPVSVPGFETEAVSCESHGTVTALLSRPAPVPGAAWKGGTVGDLRYAVDASDPDVTVRRIGDDTFNVGFAADPLEDVAEKTDLVPFDKVEDYVRSHLEEWGVRTEHKDGKNLTKARELPNGETEQVVYGKVRELTFDAPYGPSAFTPILGRIPGLVINSVEWIPSTDTYKFKGEYHVEVPVVGAV